MLVRVNIIIAARQCKHCGRLFTPRRDRHFFCCRVCFKRYWYRAKKTIGSPIFRCDHCGKETQLDFDPRSNIKKWALFRCPFCGVARVTEGEIQIFKD